MEICAAVVRIYCSVEYRNSFVRLDLGFVKVVVRALRRRKGEPGAGVARPRGDASRGGVY